MNAHNFFNSRSNSKDQEPAAPRLTTVPTDTMPLIMPLKPLQNSNSAEREMMSLRSLSQRSTSQRSTSQRSTSLRSLSFRGSVSRRPSLRRMSSVSNLNLSILEDRYRCCDIYPRVRLDLAREKDRKKTRRVKAALEVAKAMSESLHETFTGDEKRSKLILLIEISIVSDGCSSPYKNRIASLFGKGMEQGRGLAKLTVSYCLYSRETGQVAVSKQLSRVEECDCTSKGSLSDSLKSTGSSRSSLQRQSVLLELEEELRREICKEVKFTCCSRLPEWSQFSMRMLSDMHTDDETERSYL